MFNYSPLSIVYYLLGTTGWGSMFGGCPTEPWNPTPQTAQSNFGIQSNRFGLIVH
jgi:hypothetical protein